MQDQDRIATLQRLAVCEARLQAQAQDICRLERRANRAEAKADWAVGLVILTLGSVVAAVIASVIRG